MLLGDRSMIVNVWMLVLLSCNVNKKLVRGRKKKWIMFCKIGYGWCNC